jgi:hypothetical protein
LSSHQVQANVNASYNAGRTTLCADDFNLIRDYVVDSNVTIENESLLTVRGWNSMMNLAQRFQNSFPTLLPSDYNRTQFLFRHTFRQRSQGSIRAFTDGLFGGNAFERVVFEDIPVQDTLLRVS